MLSSRSVLAPLSLGLLLALSGCSKKGGGTKGPSGMSEEEVEQKKKEAQAQAKVNALIVQANEALRAGRYVTATKIAEDALAENDQNADGWVVLGAANWSAGNYEASTEALQKAMEIDPTNFGGAIALARNLRAGAEYEQSLAVLEPLVEAESEGFEEKPCEKLEDCEDIAGWCDTQAKVCKPPVLVDTRVGQLWAHYMMLDTEKGPAVADEVFLSGAQAADLTVEAIRAYSGFLNAFAGQGPLVEIEGESGSSTAGIDATSGLLNSFAVIRSGSDEQPATALFSPLQIESRISRQVVDALGLEVVGKTAVFNLGEFELVLIPEVEFNGLKIKNIPALIDEDNLMGFSGGLPEAAGVLLGHQVLNRIGSLQANFATQELTVTKAPPSAAPEGAVERPLIALDLWYLHAPATKVSIDSSDFSFWAWLGYPNPSAVTLTEKAFLKSGHLPREVENPEDAEYGRKMVYVDQVSFGELSTVGLGGLVYLDEPGEMNIAQVRNFAGFELGGFVNVALLETLEVTWSYPSGKVWFEAAGALAEAKSEG